MFNSSTSHSAICRSRPFNLIYEMVLTGVDGLWIVFYERARLHILQQLMVIYLNFHGKLSPPGLSITVLIISTLRDEMTESVHTCNLLSDVLLYQKIYTGFRQCHREPVQRQR